MRAKLAIRLVYRGQFILYAGHESCGAALLKPPTTGRVSGTDTLGPTVHQGMLNNPCATRLRGGYASAKDARDG